MKLRVPGAALVLFAAGFGACPAAAQPLPEAVATHLAAAKRAAGTDFSGTLARICTIPDNIMPGRRAPNAAGPRPTPDRADWYAEPYKVFDNLYWVGTKVHSSWALKTSEGLILIDTLYNYAVEPEIVEGLKKLKLDPKTIKYVIISHAHGDHDEGAKLLQDRYGAHVIFGAADWDGVEKQTAMPGGVPKRDMVGTDGMKVTLGDTTVTLVTTPGHTPGTLSAIFPVKDKGRTLTVAYSGGTAFNFPSTDANYATYIASAHKMGAAAKAAGATILMSNHTEFDRAYDRVRLAQMPRKAGEAHPYEIGAEKIANYFIVTSECAEAAKLQVK